MKRFSDEQLRHLRNDIKIIWVIETLLELPNKEVEGVYRFLCPECNEFQTGINPNTNLGRCFRCKKNWNPIELVMADKGLTFAQSVNLLLQTELSANKELKHKQYVSTGDVLRRAQIPYQHSFRLNISFGDD